MGQCRDKLFEGRPHEVWKVLCSDSIRTYLRTYQKQRHPWHWVRTALASPPSSSSPANDTDMTWHLTCDIDMPHHASVSRHWDHPGPLLETMPCIGNYVRFLSRWFKHAFSNACRKTSHNWLHHRNSSGTWQMVCCCVRHCLSLTWTAIAPGSPAQRFHVPNETHFAIHSKTQTWLYKNSE